MRLPPGSYLPLFQDWTGTPFRRVRGVGEPCPAVAQLYVGEGACFMVGSKHPQLLVLPSVTVCPS